MDGPERLVAGGPPLRPRTWLVAVVVVVLLAGVGVVRLLGRDDRSRPAPGPVTPTSASSASSAEWPAGVGFGTLLVLDDDGLVQVDVGSGLVDRSTVAVSASSDTMTAAWGGALVSRRDGTRAPLFVWIGQGLGSEVSGTARSGRQFLPGPDYSLWVGGTRRGSSDTAHGTWRLVDSDGTVSRTTDLTGSVLGDGAGGLFAVRDQQVTHLGAEAREPGFTGRVVATGPDGFAVLRCATSVCSTVLQDRATRRETAVADTAPDQRGVAALAPGNQLVATSLPASPSSDSPTVVRVSEPGTGRTRRVITSEDVGAALLWVSERWLVVTTGHGLVLYDALDDVVAEPELSLRDPDALVYLPG